MTPVDNIHSLAGPYALDALDDLERVRFEHHLDQCADCVLEVAEFLETTALLGQVDEIPVPAAMRAAVLEEIDSVRQVGPSRAVVRRMAPRLASVAAAVLAVAVVGLSVVTAGLRSQVSELEDLAGIAQILTAEDAVTPMAVADGGRINIVASPSSGAGAILASNLAAAPNGHAYQLWLITVDGEALPAGFLEIGPDGRGEQMMRGDMEGVVAIGISVEPIGGSPQPTTDPIAVVTLTA